jgi:hypothetical protein
MISATRWRRWWPRLTEGANAISPELKGRMEEMAQHNLSGLPSMMNELRASMQKALDDALKR